MDDLLTSYPPAEEAPLLQSAPGLGPQIPNPMLQSAPGLNQPPPEPPQEFTQADSLRAQRLQAGLSAAQSQVDDGTLAPEEGAQLQQHINRVLQPLRQRQQQTQQRQRQQMKAQLMDETALQESMEAQHAKLAAQAFPETVSQFTDPMSGRTEHFYQHRRGEWKPIEYGVDQQERDRRAEDLRQLATGADSGTGPGQDPTLEQMVEQVRQEPARPPEPEGGEPAWQDQSDPAPSVDYFPLGLAQVLGEAAPEDALTRYRKGLAAKGLTDQSARQPEAAPQQPAPRQQSAPPPAELDEAEKALVTKEITQRLGPRPQVPQPDFSQPLPPNWRQIQAGYEHAQHQWDASWQHLHDQWRQDKVQKAHAEQAAQRWQQGQESIAARQQRAQHFREQQQQAREDAQKARDEARQEAKERAAQHREDTKQHTDYWLALRKQAREELVAGGALKPTSQDVEERAQDIHHWLHKGEPGWKADEPQAPGQSAPGQPSAQPAGDTISDAQAKELGEFLAQGDPQAVAQTMAGMPTAHAARIAPYLRAAQAGRGAAADALRKAQERAQQQKPALDARRAQEQNSQTSMELGAGYGG